MIGWVEAAQAGCAGSAPVVDFAPNAFIKIDRDGKVTVISPMIEMGQGTYTSLPMLVAEELDVDMANVGVEHSPPSDKLYGNPVLGGVQITGGSASIRGFYMPMREAGAAARQMLVAAAATQARRRCGRADDGGRARRPRQERAEHRLRRAGRRRGEAARADRRQAQGSEQVPHHRHAGQAARRFRQGQRRGDVRHRRDSCPA